MAKVHVSALMSFNDLEKDVVRMFGDELDVSSERFDELNRKGMESIGAPLAAKVDRKRRTGKAE